MEERILLIEDDQDHAELITDVLKEDDVKDVKTEVILKKDGQEAINYFQHETMPQVSLVILDLNLPKVDGMEVLKFAKSNSRYCSIPIIVLFYDTLKGIKAKFFQEFYLFSKISIRSWLYKITVSSILKRFINLFLIGTR